jgi:predicted nucleotidyltransferase
VFGLNETDSNHIKEAISHYPEIDQAIIFGSRAKGNYNSGSDIDIALKGNNLSNEILFKLRDELTEQLPLPYFFDLVIYNTITNKELIQHIDRAGKEI